VGYITNKSSPTSTLPKCGAELHNMVEAGIIKKGKLGLGFRDL